jgi:hypothetical protein
MKKLPPVKALDRAARLRESLPSAVPTGRGRGGGRGAPLQLVIPEPLLLELKVRAAKESTTVRALVLGALRGAGFKVPAGEEVDRRRA